MKQPDPNPSELYLLKDSMIDTTASKKYPYKLILTGKLRNHMRNKCNYRTLIFIYKTMEKAEEDRKAIWDEAIRTGYKEP